MIITYELAGHAIFRVIYKGEIIGWTTLQQDINRDSYWISKSYSKATIFKGKHRHDASKKLIKSSLQG